MLTIVMCLSFFSSGSSAAADAFAQGELYLITFGKISQEVIRDSVTGMRFGSIGCVIRDGDIQYLEDWNQFMFRAWETLNPDRAYYSIHTPTESIECDHGVCTFVNSGSSVPVELYPEEYAFIAFLGNTDTRVEAEIYGRLKMLIPPMEDTLFVTVPLDGDVIQDLFQRGRETVRASTLN